MIASAPTGYNYVDKPRPRTSSTSDDLLINHGGVALFYRCDLHVREVMLPEYKTFEHVSAFLRCPAFSTLTVVIYRPGSVHASDSFFDDLSDMLEHTSTYANLLIIGDINLHLDNTTDALTCKFRHLLAVHSLTQHVSVPTHNLGHTLDVVITRDEQTLESVTVDPPMLSDHSQIVAKLSVRLPHSHTGVRRVRRCWRQLDIDSVQQDLLQSELVLNPPSNVDDFFACYNDVLCSLVDKHAPVKSVVIRTRARSPWYDGDCRDMKRKTRCLERKYRRTRDAADLDRWKKQLDYQRSYFQTKYAIYWSSAVAECRHDSKALWTKLSVLLRPPTAASTSGHSVDDFTDFFINKVDDIQSATSNASPTMIAFRQTPPFSHCYGTQSV